MTYDQMAVKILLDGKLSNAERDRSLRALAKQARNQIRGTLPCPECDDNGPHDDNGDQHDLTYCCRKCGEHFCADG